MPLLLKPLNPTNKTESQPLDQPVPLAAALLGSEGFDASKGIWRNTGWRELDKLRKVGFLFFKGF